MFNLKVYAMKKQRFFEELRLKVCVTLAVCMALLLNAPFLGAQNSTIKVKGVVNDAMGPVIGASIVEKGNTGNGTITDIDGNFSLNVSSNSTLIVSFVGYKAQEIPVAEKRANINRKIFLRFVNDLLDSAFEPLQSEMQVYGVIVTRDQKRKTGWHRLVSNQPIVKTAPVVLTFCIDLHHFT